MKLCFAITFCERDADLMEPCTDALRALYPSAVIVTVPDSPRMKLGSFGGQWTERWMRAAMKSSPDIVVKLDPDTRAVQVSNFPSGDIFGMVAPTGTYFPGSDGILSGGAIGFQKAAIEKILNSGLLQDSKYTETPYTTEERRTTPREVIALQDPIVHDIAQQLGLYEGVWDGLDIHYSWEPSRPFRSDATFVHPVKQ